MSPIWSSPTPGCTTAGSCSGPWPTWPPSSSRRAPRPGWQEKCTPRVESKEVRTAPTTGLERQELAMSATSLRVIGPGRAGLSLSHALSAAGWRVEAPLGRDDDVRAAAHGVDLLVIATPDAAVA